MIPQGGRRPGGPGDTVPLQLAPGKVWEPPMTMPAIAYERYSLTQVRAANDYRMASDTAWAAFSAAMTEANRAYESVMAMAAAELDRARPRSA